MEWTIDDIRSSVFSPIEKDYETRHCTSLSLFSLHESSRISSNTLEHRMAGITLNEPETEEEPNLVKWKDVPDAYKVEWSLRARRLNERNPVGDFKSYVEDIDTERLCELVKRDCEINFKTIRSSLKSCITQISKGDSKKIYYMPHSNALELQSYRRLYANSIICEMIIGVDNCNIMEHEVVVDATNEFIIHISSARRASELFDVDGINIAKIMNWEKSYYSQACGKVHISDLNGKHGFGLILDESADGKDLHIATEQGKIIKMKKPMYEGYSLGYEKTEQIDVFSPICIRFTQNMFTFEFPSSRVVRSISTPRPLT